MYVTPSGDIACKIILYGPAEAGRGTFLISLHNHLSANDVSPIQEIDLDGENAQAFIWKSGQTVDVKGRSLVITVATLSGRSRVAQARRSLVEASDGIIFIADTRRLKLDNNIDAMNDLMEHLRFHNLPSELPTVIAYNRHDDPEALATRQLDPLLNHFSAPSIETVAIEGKGIDAAWITMVSILAPEADEALDNLPQGPAPSLGDEGEHGCLLSCHACGSMLEVDAAIPGDIFTCGSCGATLKVIHPETGMTGPVSPSDTAPITQSGIQQRSSNGTVGAESKSYSLQSLPSPIDDSEALDVASATGPISAAMPFELPGFDLLKELDSSPLGQRYRLYEHEKNRKLRTFRIDPTVVASSGYRVQIEPYVRMAAKVNHQSIVTILGLRWQGNTPYLISEDVSNFESLSSILSRRRRLSPLQSLEIGLQIAIGLEEAARHGVIHGFLRPDVVLISPENHVMIDDIGIPKAHAHLIQSLEGQSPSTEYYLAPEHLLVDAASDIRSDMFLLGALLFRMVTAEGLITGFNAVEALHRFSATGAATIAEYSSMIPRDMMNLLNKLTSADRRDRFQHYGEAIESIERVIGSLSRRAGATGTQGARTGARRKPTGQTKRGTRSPYKTGPISASTGSYEKTRTRSGSTPATRRKTGTHGNRRSQNFHEEEETLSYRNRKKKSGPSAAIITIVLLLVVLVAGVGYYAYL